jgi:hypothetical protein
LDPISWLFHAIIAPFIVLGFIIWGFGYLAGDTRGDMVRNYIHFCVKLVQLLFAPIVRLVGAVSLRGAAALGAALDHHVNRLLEKIPPASGTNSIPTAVPYNPPPAAPPDYEPSNNSAETPPPPSPAPAPSPPPPAPTTACKSTGYNKKKPTIKTIIPESEDDD